MTKFFTELFNYFFIIQLPTVWWKIKSKFFWSAFSSHQLGMKTVQIQVNLCQNLVFLHQLTNNMTTNFSLNYKFNTWKFQAQNMGRTCCVLKLFLTFRTIYVHNMFSPCSAKIRASDKDLPVIEFNHCWDIEPRNRENYSRKVIIQWMILIKKIRYR